MYHEAVKILRQGFRVFFPLKKGFSPQPLGPAWVFPKLWIMGELIHNLGWMLYMIFLMKWSSTITNLDNNFGWSDERNWIWEDWWLERLWNMIDHWIWVPSSLLGFVKFRNFQSSISLSFLIQFDLFTPFLETSERDRKFWTHFRYLFTMRNGPKRPLKLAAVRSSSLQKLGTWSKG